MWNKRLCLSVNRQFGIPAEEQIKLFKTAGFDGFFVCWGEGDNIEACA